jgi:hypothetical protein
MTKPGQGQLLGADGAARVLGGLQHDHRSARAGEPDGCSEAVGPAADHDRVAHAAICSAS